MDNAHLMGVPEGVERLDHEAHAPIGVEPAVGKLVLLLGGKDKGLPLDALAEAARTCTRIHAYGQGGRRFAECCSALGIEVRVHDGIRSAAQESLEMAGIEETILFSPSFSSYDEFRNFRDRAELFRGMCHAAASAGEPSDEDSFLN